MTTENKNTAQDKSNAANKIESVAIPQVFQGTLPDLSQAEAAPFDLMGEYWTPTEIGETKRLFFNEIKTEVVADSVTGEDIELQTAYFIQYDNGTARTIRQASKRLVGMLETQVSMGKITSGTPLEITYKGKQKNKTNSFSGDTWAVKPLIIKQ